MRNMTTVGKFWLTYLAILITLVIAGWQYAQGAELIIGVGTSEMRRPATLGHWEQDPFIASGAVKTPRSEDDHDVSYRLGVRMGDFELAYNNLGQYKLHLGFVNCEGDQPGCVGSDMAAFTRGECYQVSPCGYDITAAHSVRAHTLSLTWAPYYRVWGFDVGPRLGVAYFTQHWVSAFSTGFQVDTTVHGWTQTLGAGIRYGRWAMTYDKYATLETDKDMCCSPVQKGSQFSINYAIPF